MDLVVLVEEPSQYAVDTLYDLHDHVMIISIPLCTKQPHKRTGTSSNLIDITTLLIIIKLSPHSVFNSVCVG